MMFPNKSIKKHVAIIHAHSLMSVLQRKIVNVLLYEASKDKENLNNKNSVCIERRISFHNLCKSVKFNSNNTQYFKEAIDGLASLKIEWNLLKDKVPTDISFLNLRVLHGPPTFYQDGTLNFSFHKVMLDLVENPLIYGVVDVELQSNFESKYSHSLYENSTRFINLQKNKIIQLDTFKKMLGVKQDKYSSMKEFTRNAIAPSVEEVNDRANFVVNLQSVKIGRKITGFEISVESKKKSVAIRQDANGPINEIIRKEIEHTFDTISNHVLEDILSSYPENYLLEKIKYTKKYAKKDRNGLYPVPYLITALRDDYKSSDLVCASVQEEPNDEDSKWKKDLSQLESDLIYWEKLLELAKKEQNSFEVNNRLGIVSKCRERIQKHLAERLNYSKAT